MTTTEAGIPTTHKNLKLRKTLARIAFYVTVIAVSLLTFFPI